MLNSQFSSDENWELSIGQIVPCVCPRIKALLVLPTRPQSVGLIILAKSPCFTFLIRNRTGEDAQDCVVSDQISVSHATCGHLWFESWSLCSTAFAAFLLKFPLEHCKRAVHCNAAGAGRGSRRRSGGRREYYGNQ